MQRTNREIETLPERKANFFFRMGNITEASILLQIIFTALHLLLTIAISFLMGSLCPSVPNFSLSKMQQLIFSPLVLECNAVC